MKQSRIQPMLDRTSRNEHTLKPRRCIVVIILLTGGGLCMTACDGSSPGESDERAQRAVRTEEQMQRIRSLPYAGEVITENVDEGRVVLDRDDRDRIRTIPLAEEVGRTAKKEGLLTIDEQRSHPGYTLYCAFMAGTAILVDHHGGEVKRWTLPGTQWASVELLPNGDLVTVGADRRPGEIQDDERFALRMNWQGEVLWRVTLTTHHDITYRDDGNLTTLVFERGTIESDRPDLSVRDDRVAILSPEGELLHSVSLYHSIKDRERFPLVNNRPYEVGGVMTVDVFHSNSVEWMDQPHLFGRDPIYAPDNLLICSRNQDRIWVLDMKREQMIWSWGLGELSGPHDAHVLPNGNIMLFDNGLRTLRSRVIEIDPARGTIVWEFPPPDGPRFYSESKSSAQRLPNDNVLICNADSGEIFEVTRGGDVVWHYLCPVRNRRGARRSLYNAIRYEPQFIEDLFERYASTDKETP